MKTRFATGLLIFAAGLTGCANSVPEKAPETRVIADAPAPNNKLVVTTASLAGFESAAAPEEQYGKDGLPVQSGALRFSLIEISVPEKAALDASLMALDEGKNETEGKGSLLFETLLASARSGESTLRVSSLRLKNMQASTFKSATLLRYPESFSQIQAQTFPIAKDSPSQPGVNAAPSTWTSSYPVKSQVGPGYAITAGTPQDYTMQEIGLVLEVTPVIRADSRTVDLDMRPKRVVLDVAPGEIPEGGTDLPGQPRFSIWSTEQKLTVKRGAATFLAALPPAPLAKDQRTVFLFVRVD